MEYDTIAAIATPPGKGALAVLRLSGDGAFAVAQRVFIPKNRDKNLLEMPEYTALFGTFCGQDGPIDEGVALLFRAPNSYTGEDVVEFSCHGSDVLTRQLLLACYDAGARPAGPGEFTKRAVLNGKMELTQAEAVMELIEAASEKGAAVARSALSGALQAEIEQIKARLNAEAAHLCAWIDYPEEDVEPLELEHLTGELTACRKKLQTLVQQYRTSELLRRGVRTVIAGSPNVGKSTLFNLMSGFPRAIVTPQAGTTRDVLREEITAAGVTLRVSDTAGLRETDDIVEREGIKRSYDEMDTADLIIAVFDSSASLGEEEMRLATLCAGKAALAVVNKSDLGREIDEKSLEPYFREVLTVTALAPETRAVLEGAIARVLAIADVNPEHAMLFNARQLDAAIKAQQSLGEALELLQNGEIYDVSSLCVEDALRSLSEITGENATDAIIEQVFQKFCVGK